VSIDREARIERGYFELRSENEKLTEMYRLHARLIDETIGLLPRLNGELTDMGIRLNHEYGVALAATQEHTEYLEPIEQEALRQYMIITSSRSYSILSKHIFPLIDRLRGARKSPP
jgi:hypothetical protein